MKKPCINCDGPGDRCFNICSPHQHWLEHRDEPEKEPEKVPGKYNLFFYRPNECVKTELTKRPSK